MALCRDSTYHPVRFQFCLSRVPMVVRQILHSWNGGRHEVERVSSKHQDDARGHRKIVTRPEGVFGRTHFHCFAFRTAGGRIVRRSTTYPLCLQPTTPTFTRFGAYAQQPPGTVNVAACVSIRRGVTDLAAAPRQDSAMRRLEDATSSTGEHLYEFVSFGDSTDCLHRNASIVWVLLR